MAEPACDVVIASRNRPKALVECLRALQRQTFTDFRVIVVDDHSDPGQGPQPSLEEFADLRIDLVELPQQRGPAAARNAGVALASAELVAFIDDDVVADRRMLEIHVANCRGRAADEPFVVSFGPFVQPADWSSTPWNHWEALQAKKEADAMLRGDYEPSWRQFHTGNNCLPLELFRSVGGFDERFKRSEDDEFGLRVDAAGARFRFAPDAIAWHYSHRSLEAWLAIPRAYAYFDVMIDGIYPDYGYLDQKLTELRRRRLPLRAARRILGGERGSALGIHGAVVAARVLHRLGATKLASGGLSVAYDLSYARGIAEHAGANRRDAMPGAR